jgi:hypothetical protein
VEHGEESTLDLPVVLLEELEDLRRRSKEQVGGDLIVHLEELLKLLGDGEDDVEMRAIGQALAEPLGPFGLARSEAVGAMAVPAGAGVPILVVAVLAGDLVEAERALPALGEKVERRILPLLEPAGPEVAPMEKDVVDCSFDADYLNTMNSPMQARLFVRTPTNF